ncbi:MAG TPA: polyhydroxyalkanoic acid system family protein [Candidatus Paceibacterota bacterium]
MPKLDITIPHKLPREEATRRIKTLLAEVKEKFVDKIENLEERWVGTVGNFNFTVMGFSVSGTLNVGESTVYLESKIPFAALLFKSTIEKKIREGATDLLA